MSGVDSEGMESGGTETDQSSIHRPTRSADKRDKVHTKNRSGAALLGLVHSQILKKNAKDVKVGRKQDSLGGIFFVLLVSVI